MYFNIDLKLISLFLSAHLCKYNVLLLLLLLLLLLYAATMFYCFAAICLFWIHRYDICVKMFDLHNKSAWKNLSVQATRSRFVFVYFEELNRMCICVCSQKEWFVRLKTKQFKYYITIFHMSHRKLVHILRNNIWNTNVS